MTDAPIHRTSTAPVATTSEAPVLSVVRDRGIYERRIKRVIDLAGGVVIGLLALPVIAVIALGIRSRLGPGVIYSQQRVGMAGEAFTIHKFRTMRPDRRHRDDVEVEIDRRLTHKTEEDPRHTRLGRLLRRLSLDELPQLWNVIRGEMSLVGPRPELYEVAVERGYYDHPRHEVRPGMTGPYQTSDLRLGGDLRDGLDVDAEYVQNVSFGRDLGYLLKTVTTMLGGSSQGA